MFVRKYLLGLVLSVSLSCAAQELTIAAASDLQSVFPQVVAAFQQRTGKKIRVTYGSSGNFFAQIQNGAPFDLFFSADSDYPRKLLAAGLALPDSFYVYAQGKIVLWVRGDSTLSIERLGIKGLLSPTIKRIAIANPAHAPYGRAAKAALQSMGIYDDLQPKLVMGENVSQTALFIETGNAQAGFIALSLASSPRMKSKGKYLVVPQDLYPVLEQACVVLKRSKEPKLAAEFIAFLRSAAGVNAMKQAGFLLPPQGSK